MKTLIIFLILCFVPSPNKPNFKIPITDEIPAVPFKKIENPQTMVKPSCILVPDVCPELRPDYPWYLHYQSEPFKQPIPKFYIEIPLEKMYEYHRKMVD